MKYLALLILLLTSCATTHYSQTSTYPEELVSIHLIDREGMTEVISNSERLKNYQSVDFLQPQPYQRVLRVFNREPDGSIPAFITSYHPNGQVQQYLEVVNNRAHGIYREWHPNGNLKIDAYLIEGSPDLTISAEKSWLFDGSARAYNENGILIAEIPYERGSIEGCAIYYHENGLIWREVPYCHNSISGEMRVFLESGELLQTTSYSDGVKQGDSKRYWSDELLAAQEYYEKGRLLEGQYFDATGNLIAEIHEGKGRRALFSKDSVSELQEFKRGLQEGEVKVLNRKGSIVKTYHIKNGLKHGDEMIYYSHSENPQPKVLIPWYEGKIQGVAKTWYDNGVQESQKVMSGNKRNGVATAWYRSGQLMLIEEYEEDKLKKGDYFRIGEKSPISQIVNGEGIVTYFDAEGNYLRKANYLCGKPDE